MKSPLPQWRKQAFPLNWQQEFGGVERLHLEVGFGDGRYTVRRAKEEPESGFVGLELSSTSLKRAWRKLRREEIENVRILKTKAQFAVQHLFAPQSLSSIIVNFPDPWPKERHTKNRLLQTSFFRLAASRLKAEGAIYLATDHPEYLAFAREEALNSGLFTLQDAEPPEAVFETKYALKWKGQGKPLFYQVFAYNAKPAPDFPSLETPSTMPHALLAGDLPDSVTFDKLVVPYGDGHVIVHELARSLGSEDEDDKEKWLFRVSVDEPDLMQQMLVVVKRRTGDELIVRLESFGDPIITKTVRGAIHAVTEWLLEQGEELKVKERNY